MNIIVLIEKLEKLVNKKVILEDNEVYKSKYFKPIKIDERLKNIIEIDKENKIVYFFGDLGNYDVCSFLNNYVEENFPGFKIKDKTLDKLKEKGIDIDKDIEWFGADWKDTNEFIKTAKKAFRKFKVNLSLSLLADESYSEDMAKICEEVAKKNGLFMFYDPTSEGSDFISCFLSKKALPESSFTAIGYEYMGLLKEQLESLGWE